MYFPSDIEHKESLSEIIPLEGEVCLQFIRCGKIGCRCQSGRPHGPYSYRIWREGSRVRKVYVKAGEVDTVKAACTLYRSLSRSLHDLKQAKVHLAKSMRQEWNRTQGMLDT